MMRHLGVLIALLGVAACDEDNPVRYLDGGIDAPVVIDAPVEPAKVTLTVSRAGLPKVGVVVHFQKADSTLVATAMTDATGTAAQVMDAGGYVTAVDGLSLPSGAASHRVTTFAGVKPGDNLVLKDTTYTSTMMTFTLPTQPESNVGHYEIRTTCGTTSLQSGGSGSTPMGPIYLNSCGATTDLLVVKYDINSAVMGFIYQPNLVVTDQGTIDLSAATYSAATNRMYTFTNKPAAFAPITVRQHVASTKGRLVTIEATTSGVPAVATLAIPAIANGISIVEGSVFSQSGSTHQSFDWGPLTTTAYSTDIGARLLVDITGPVYDVATRKLTWDTVIAGVAPDFAITELRGTRTTASNDNRFMTWELVAPYAAGTVTYPTLPVGTYDFNWDDDDAPQVDRMQLAKVPGGYDAIRANTFTLLPSQNDSSTAIIGASGSAQFVTYASQAPARTLPARKTALQHRTQRTR